MKSVALLTKISEFSEGKNLPFEVHITWEDLDRGNQHESAVVSSTLKVVSPKKVEEAAINTTVVRKVADLFEASLAYEAMILNEQHDFINASELYQDNMICYNLIVDPLEDSDSRVNRFKLAQKKVSNEWLGRSKRASFSMSKKMMLSEPDLRERDAGEWHDEL